jgi:hypothetical protein
LLTMITFALNVQANTDSFFARLTHAIDKTLRYDEVKLQRITQLKPRWTPGRH